MFKVNNNNTLVNSVPQARKANTILEVYKDQTEFLLIF